VVVEPVERVRVSPSRRFPPRRVILESFILVPVVVGRVGRSLNHVLYTKSARVILEMLEGYRWGGGDGR
jgi:hypothetical protein